MPPDPNAQQSINDQNVYIRDTLMSIAAKYSETLKEAVESAFDNVDATVLENVGKDLTRSFTKLAKMSDDFALNQSRIKKGLIDQKDIEKQIQSIQEKRELLERKIEHARRLGLEVSRADYDAALESLKVQEEQLENDKKLAKSVSGKVGLQKAFNDLQDKFNVKQLKDTFTLAGIFKILIDSAIKFNNISVDIGKNLGYGTDNANKTTSGILNIAQSARNVNITLANAVEAMGQLSTATGFVAEYSADALETQIMLTKQFGLTGDEAAGIYKLSVLTGKSSEKVNDEMVGAFVAARNASKVGVPFKATIAEAAKVSGQLKANLGANPASIVKAVVAAKALGTSLEQTSSQGEKLLDFGSSITSELQAELLTGKQLNLERARAAALAGDQVTLAEELAKNVGTYEEFTRMNVLQQKALAESVGLTADQLASQLEKQKLAQESGKSLAQITKEEALEAEKRQNIQDKFNQSILKLQDFIGNLTAGPLAGLLDLLTQALDIVTLITMPFKFIYDMTSYIGNILGGWLDKLGIAGKLLKGIAGIAIISAAYSTFKAVSEGLASTGIGGLLAPALGGAAAAAVTAAGFGLLNSGKADDMVSEGGYGKRTLLAPEGAFKLNDKDTVIAGTNLGGGEGTSMPSIDLTPMISAINEVKAAVDRLYNKDTSINMDGKKVGSTLVQGTYKVA